MLGALTGCSVASVSRTLPDGSRVTGWTGRCLWHTENFTLKVATTNGVLLEVGLSKSVTDAKSVEAIATGVTTAILKSGTGL